MSIEHVANQATIDILDRVLDKGIVVDAWVRVSFSGIDVLSAEARLVVGSIETYGEPVREMIVSVLPKSA
jgi:hypothetical protein